MELSTNAQALLAKVAHYTMAAETLPVTNAAGGSSDTRKALAELRAAGLVQVFKNAYTRPGHMVVRVTKAGKVAADALGIVGFDHSGIYRTYGGGFTHTYA